MGTRTKGPEAMQLRIILTLQQVVRTIPASAKDNSIQFFLDRQRKGKQWGQPCIIDSAAEGGGFSAGF